MSSITYYIVLSEALPCRCIVMSIMILARKALATRTERSRSMAVPTFGSRDDVRVGCFPGLHSGVQTSLAETLSLRHSTWSG